MGKVKIHFTGKEMDYVAKEENRMTEVAKRIEKASRTDGRAEYRCICCTNCRFPSK